MTRALLLIVLAARAFAQTAEFPDPASLAEELDRIKSVLQRGGEPGVLPDAWKIRSPPFSIPTKTLRNANKENRIVELGGLSRELRGYSKPAEFPAASEKLNQILSRSEFSAAAPPSQWELMRQRVIEWLQDLLRRIFDFAAQRPTTSKILFWTILSLALIGIVWFLSRLWVRPKESVLFRAAPGVVQTSRTADEWIRAARLAAEKGDLAAAIQCAYWAGIMRLEETSALPAHRACTPREYLGLTATQQLAPMKILTTALERFWYGRQQPAAQDFQTSLQQLEALGCKLD